MADVNDPVRLGVVGYGVGGRRFHTPFIDAANGVMLAGVVTRSSDRRAEVEADWPGTPVFERMADLLAADVEAVTITTPPATRRDLVLEALAAGVHVVADKPFAPDAPTARELVAAADAAGVLLSVFQNRRWDTDLLTLARVVEEGRVGQPWRVHSRLDFDDPATLETGAAGGLLRDLGSHLVDQMIWLLGPVAEVAGHLDWLDLPEGRTDAGFAVQLRHVNGVTSCVEASKANHAVGRDLRVYGSLGSYSSQGSDVQGDATLAGRRPAADPAGWGFEDAARWGTLATDAGRETVPSSQGRWHDFYSQFAAAVRGEGEQPVPGREAVHTVEVLDAARDSAAAGSSITVRSLGRP